MKKRNITLGLLSSLIAIAPSVMQAEDCCLPCYRPGEPLCGEAACGVYTQYAGVQLECGWNVFAYGEFLYWRMVNENAWGTIRVDNAELGQPALNTTQTLLVNDFGYKPAFVVGIGMNLPCFDNWQLKADYLWYHHNFSTSYSATAPAFLASTTAAATDLVAPVYSRSRVDYKLDLDVVTAKVQRPNYLGQRVILSPFLGFKWSLCKQNYQQVLFQPETNIDDTVDVVVRYDRVGIGAGMDGSWLFCGNFRMIGQADVALLYPYKQSFDQVVVETPLPIIVKLKQRDRHLDILARGGVGLGWGTYFCCNRYHVDFAATFDWMSDVVKMTFNTGAMEGTAYLLMGLSIRGQFDF